MKYYLAPMEGITGFVFRNAYHEYFAPMDKYFTPFISPNQNRCFTPREYREICPENNRIPHVVPQILTNKAEDFIKTSQELARMGYEEVNLNLGCPSGTVTAKRKGAGFLMEPDRLREFFERIFEKPCVEISVKTRLGMYSVDEFPQLLSIFSDYPLKELIIHPRVGKEFYDGVPHRDVYLEAVGKSRQFRADFNPFCYNGDLYCAEDVKRLLQECQEAEHEAGLVRECQETEHEAELVWECREAEHEAGLVQECREAEHEAGFVRKCREAESVAGLACKYQEAEGRGESVRRTAKNPSGGCVPEYSGKAMPDAPGGVTAAVMFGRGILRDPWLAEKCRRMEADAALSSLFFDAARILEFSDRLFSDYAQYMGEHNAMFRMKELWLYLVESFADADGNRKKLKKAQNRAEFSAVLSKLAMRRDN